MTWRGIGYRRIGLAGHRRSSKLPLYVSSVDVKQTWSATYGPDRSSAPRACARDPARTISGAYESGAHRTRFAASARHGGQNRAALAPGHGVYEPDETLRDDRSADCQRHWSPVRGAR